MCSWRSKGSIISRWCAASIVLALFVSVFPSGPSWAAPKEAKKEPKKEETHEGVTLDITVALVGITAFQDFQEIRAGLLKSEGVQKVVVDSEAPGLISLKVTYLGEAMSLIDKLSDFFPKKYDMKEKRLSGGGTEVDISRKQSPSA